MTNEIKTWEPLRKWAKAAARGETDKIPYIDIVTLIDENAELRAKVESLAADAERWRWLRRSDERLGNSPWPEHGVCWVVQYHHPKGTIPETRSAGHGAALDAIIDLEMAKEKS